MKEYFKITETLKLIDIAKEESKQDETITKNRINHLSTNVNLMRESAKFEKDRILEEIDKWFKETTEKLQGSEEDYLAVSRDEIEELKNVIRGKEMIECCGRQCHFDGDTTDYSMCGDKFKNSNEIFICHKCKLKDAPQNKEVVKK